MPRVTCVANIWLLFACVLAVSPQAFSQVSDLSESDRDFITVRFGAARKLEAAGQFANATAEYKAILDKYPLAVPRIYQNLGILYFHMKKYEYAIRTFEAGLRLDPGMAGSQLFLGNALLFTEQPEKALPHLVEAHKIQPTAESAMSLGQAYAAHLRYEEAARYFKKALSQSGKQDEDNLLYLLGKTYLSLSEQIVNSQTEAHPESKYSQLLAARIFESQDSYQVAAIKYLETAELDPMNASLFFPLARMLAVLGLERPSQLALDRYRTLVPWDKEATLGRAKLPKEQVAEIGTKVDFEGILLSLAAVNKDNLPPLPIFSSEVNAALRERLKTDRAGRWKAVVSCFQSGRLKEAAVGLMAVTPGNSDWLRSYLLASAQLALADYEAVEETVSAPALATVDSEPVQALRGEIYRLLSLQRFNELIEKHPGSCRSYLVKARQLALREKGEAEAEFRSAINGCPDAVQFRVELADFYLANSRLEEGMKECLEELALNPHSSAAKLRIGRIHVQLLKAKEALPYLLDGLKTDTDNAGGHTDLARAYELLREWEKAIEQYKAALDLDPSLNRVHYVLARIYRQLGREDQAKREVEIFRSTEAKDRERRTQEIQKLRKRDAPTKQTP